MSSASSENKRHLPYRIINALENGGRLTDAILDYIEATLFAPDPERLAAFLADDADSQRDSLLDLIFFPDQAVQLDLETQLEASRCSVADEDALRGRLIERAIHARITMPDGSLLASLELPDGIKSQYLERLNIAWQMDPLLAAAIGKGVSEAFRSMVKVRLRNAGMRFTHNQQVFLGRFFACMTDSDPDYLASLDLVLSILGQSKDQADGYSLLVERKHCLYRSLEQAMRFATLLGQSNMETLMLQGVRAPHVSPGELMHHMRLIDLICLGMFGQTEAIDRPTEETVREVVNLETPEAVMQALLR